MTENIIIDMFVQVLVLIIKVSAPMLLVSLVVGLVISILQTITSIQEQTLTFVPKIIAVFVGMMIFGSWILNNLSGFIDRLWSDFSIYLG